MTKFVGLRAKVYSYLIDGGNEENKEKGTINCLEATQHDNKIKYFQ